MNKFIDDFATKVINSGLSSQRDTRGCRDFEVTDLEKHFDLELPAMYKDFLRRMGKGAGKFMQGNDIFYKHLFENRRAMEDVLESDKHPFDLPKNSFVFSSHQGYIFFFFDTSGGLDDPPVFGYAEGEHKVRNIDETFSAFLLRLLNEELSVDLR